MFGLRNGGELMEKKCQEILAVQQVGFWFEVACGGKLSG
jgi:hypothetical protein